MLKGWPLRSPPKIAGDSVSLALTTGFANVTLPHTTDGDPAKFVLVCWEGAAPLNIGYSGTNFGPQFHEYSQPILLSVVGLDSMTALKARLGAGTGKLRLTPVEV